MNQERIEQMAHNHLATLSNMAASIQAFVDDADVREATPEILANLNQCINDIGRGMGRVGMLPHQGTYRSPRPGGAA